MIIKINKQKVKLTSILPAHQNYRYSFDEMLYIRKNATSQDYSFGHNKKHFLLHANFQFLAIIDISLLTSNSISLLPLNYEFQKMVIERCPFLKNLYFGSILIEQIIPKYTALVFKSYRDDYLIIFNEKYGN